ncbi:ATP-binding protein [Actinoplanes sp. DH11]|uniref:HD domain-containing protein n=1 Tax=Actinoplanes sp. DH11 TaxID=2857011 RepID=UPI001E2C78DA|nr:ATP-binding protein [Actinoplanes sp. DH11]
MTKVRSDVAEILDKFGRLGIFEQYTKHDMSHVDGMLKLYDWLIPDGTRQIMTPAEWLLLTLGTYFHDLGLIVTSAEYSRRSETAFLDYKQEFGDAEDSQSSDYRAQVNQLRGEVLERFLYQEFVRTNHAKRIRGWITGNPDATLGFDQGLVDHISATFADMPAVFVKDLALVCESHHLDDLHATSKYKVDRPYGSDPQEAANVQYAAILLRTADLLHITSDRAPSIALRLINPTDPMSQTEWSKQNAVTAVRPAIALMEDGRADRSAPRDTIEVHAEFTDENGFFGLTSYLQYSDREIAQNWRWAAASNAELDVPHEYPWRQVNADHVIADGFIAEPFEFQIDQYKVLELLTGHTLYNDTNVVVRELVQNSIDAVRLQEHVLSDPHYHPTVVVKWDPEERTIEVSDNGTGMTQGIIENNFLKVGASRYQEPQFMRRYPEFNSISRFGIGVLSAFMVADEVRVVTSHLDEDRARELTLRSVHGKYLIRLLPKDSSNVSDTCKPHGTSVRMRIRPSADLEDVERILAHWVQIPGCRVLFQRKGGDLVSVGFENVDSALAAQIGEPLVPGKLEIRTVRQEGFEIAYLVMWDPWFEEWNLAVASRLQSIYEEPLEGGICVEGIRVTSVAPGFRANGSGVPAIVNVAGVGNLRTNVARTDIEPSPALDDLYRFIYGAYAKHINQEVARMQSSGYSATRAGTEANHLVSPMVGSLPANERMLDEAVSSVAAFVVETAERRRLQSLQELEVHDELISFDGVMTRNIENFLASIPSRATARDLLSFAQIDVELPTTETPYICNWTPATIFGRWFAERWHIDDLSSGLGGSTVELHWRRSSRESSDSKWIKITKRNAPQSLQGSFEVVARIARQGGWGVDEIWVAGKRFENLGDFPYGGVRIDGLSLIFRDTIEGIDFETYLEGRERDFLIGLVYFVISYKKRERRYTYSLMQDNERGASNSFIRDVLAYLDAAGVMRFASTEEMIKLIAQLSINLYESSRGYRGPWSGVPS